MEGCEVLLLEVPVLCLLRALVCSGSTGTNEIDRTLVRETGRIHLKEASYRVQMVEVNDYYLSLARALT